MHLHNMFSSLNAHFLLFACQTVVLRVVICSDVMALHVILCANSVTLTQFGSTKSTKIMRHLVTRKNATFGAHTIK